MKAIKNFIRCHTFLSALLLAVVSASIAGLFFTTSTFSSGTETKSIKDQGWSYNVTLENGKVVHAEVLTNFQSAADVEAYANAMRKENLKLFATTSKVMAAPIVFKRPLTWTEADAFVKRYKLQAGDYQYRLVDKSNPNNRYIWSVGMSIDGSDPSSSSAAAQKQLANVMQNELQGTTDFKGVIGLSADLTLQDYKSVSSDPFVYLVEMPGEIIKSKFAQDAVPELKGIDKKQVDVAKDSPQLYRRLEDFGIAPK